MASSFEKSVKGGTKIKLAAPKSKYVEHILVATHTGEAGVAEIFRAMQNRLRDSTWTIVFKGLIIVHLMIREGEQDVTLRYIAANPRKLAISNFSEVQVQGRNIRNYTQYLLERARAFRDTKVDYVRSGEGRLKKLSVEKGLLRETEAVQQQIGALGKCDVLSDEPENEITLTAFRLLVTDLLALFYVMNEGVINILEHFFEMSRYDSERALSIYKTFTRQTNEVVEYLQVARQFEHATRLEVPRLKHAPTSLTGALEEYTQDPDFEINRRQFLAQREAKKSQAKATGPGVPSTTERSKPTRPQPQSQPQSQPKPQPKPAGGDGLPLPKAAPVAPPKPGAKGLDPDLIDFFESIEQNQQPMAQSLGPPQTQTIQAQPTNPFQMQQLPQGNMHAIAPQQALFGASQMDTLQQQQQQQQQPQMVFELPGAQLHSQAAQVTGFGGFSGAAQQAPAATAMAPTLPSIPQQSPFVLQTTGFQSPQVASQPAQSVNPFRQSMMPTEPTGMADSQGSFEGAAATTTSHIARQSTNPFSRRQTSGFIDTMQYHSQSPGPSDAAGSAFSSAPNQTFQQAPVELHAQSTRPKSTNPFSQSLLPSSPQQQPQQQPQQYQQHSLNTLTPQQTGGASTNPFRQSMMPPTPSPSSPQPSQPRPQPSASAPAPALSDPSSSSVWPSHGGGGSSGGGQQQGTIGGYEHLPTLSIFPRTGQTGS